MGELTKGLIGKEDCSIASNNLYPSTFTRLSSTGGTLSLTSFPNLWEMATGGVNVMAYGTTKSIATIQACLTAIGTTTKTLVYFEPGTWVIDNTLDLSSYSNIFFGILPGATLQISSGKTLTFYSPDNILNENMPIFSGSGSVVFSISGKVCAQWWGLTDVAINAAIASIQSTGGTVDLGSGSYTQSTATITMATGVTLRGDGRKQCTITNGVAGVNSITASGIRDFNISGFYITGTGYTVGEGIYITAGVNFTLDDIECYKMGGAGIEIAGVSYVYNLSNLYLHNTNSTGASTYTGYQLIFGGASQTTGKLLHQVRIYDGYGANCKGGYDMSCNGLIVEPQIGYGLYLNTSSFRGTINGAYFELLGTSTNAIYSPNTVSVNGTINGNYIDSGANANPITIIIGDGLVLLGNDFNFSSAGTSAIYIGSASKNVFSFGNWDSKTGAPAIYTQSNLHWANNVIDYDSITASNHAQAHVGTNVNNFTTGSTVVYDTEDYDAGSNYDYTTGIFTTAAPGLYHIEATATLAGFADTEYARLFVNIGGSDARLLSDQHSVAASTTLAPAGSCDIFINNGVAVKITVTHNHGATGITLTAATGHSYFSIRKVQ